MDAEEQENRRQYEQRRRQRRQEQRQEQQQEREVEQQRKQQEQDVQVAHVLHVLCTSFDVTLEQMQVQRRDDDGLVRARQCAMWLLCTRCGLTATAVGTMLKRDHSTVVHSVQTVERALEQMEAPDSRAMPERVHALAAAACAVRDMLDGRTSQVAWNAPPHMHFDSLSIYWRKAWRRRAVEGWWKEHATVNDKGGHHVAR